MYPQFPDYHVHISYYQNTDQAVLSHIKQELRNGNPEYDYCFISTTHLISLDQLRCSLHRSIQNHSLNRMRAKTLNTEILYNLSPTNNINEALKRFGVDDSRLDVIVVKVAKEPINEAQLEQQISGLLHSEPVELNDNVLLSHVDIKKFAKLFKVSDANASQAQLSQEAIAGGLLRGC